MRTLILLGVQKEKQRLALAMQLRTSTYQIHSLHLGIFSVPWQDTGRLSGVLLPALHCLYPEECLWCLQGCWLILHKQRQALSSSERQITFDAVEEDSYWSAECITTAVMLKPIKLLLLEQALNDIWGLPLHLWPPFSLNHISFRGSRASSARKTHQWERLMQNLSLPFFLMVVCHPRQWSGKGLEHQILEAHFQSFHLQWKFVQYLKRFLRGKASRRMRCMAAKIWKFKISRHLSHISFRRSKRCS